MFQLSGVHYTALLLLRLGRLEQLEDFLLLVKYPESGTPLHVGALVVGIRFL